MNERASGVAWAKPRIGRAGVLAFIKSEIASGRPMPTREQIADHFGWTRQSAVDALLALAAAGYLRTVSRRPSGRGWSYTFELVEEADESAVAVPRRNREWRR